MNCLFPGCRATGRGGLLRHLREPRRHEGRRGAREPAVAAQGRGAVRAAAEGAAAGGPPGSHHFQESLPQKQEGEDAADETSLLGHFRGFVRNLMRAPSSLATPTPLPPHLLLAGDLHRQSQPEDAAAAGRTRAGQLPADVAAGQTPQCNTQIC